MKFALKGFTQTFSNLFLLFRTFNRFINYSNQTVDWKNPQAELFQQVLITSGIFPTNAIKHFSKPPNLSRTGYEPRSQSTANLCTWGPGCSGGWCRSAGRSRSPSWCCSPSWRCSCSSSGSRCCSPAGRCCSSGRGSHSPGRTCCWRPPGGVAGNQAPVQGANEQEAQRQAMEAQLRMQLQNLLRAPIDPVELDKRLVIDGMRRVKDLREGEYEDWILKVSDALLQAGMHAMYNITGVQRDELAEEADVRACSLYPAWALNTAWSAIRSSLPAHGPAQAKTLSIRPGDVKTLLRTIRNFYESSTINEQHSILTKLSNTNMADFSDLRSYVASLDANFARLAKMGNPQKDDTKRFFLLKGLNAEFERNCLSTIISYESRDGLSGANYDKAVKILSDWADGHKVTAKPRRETAMAAGPGKAQARQTPTEPCRRFSRGICKLGGKCRYLHVDAPGRPVQPPPNQAQEPWQCTEEHQGKGVCWSMFCLWQTWPSQERLLELQEDTGLLSRDPGEHQRVASYPHGRPGLGGS